MARFEQNLKETFNHYGFSLTEHQAAQFNVFRTELLRWNERINLTAITDDDEIVHKHFLDSLSVLEHISLRSNDSVVDIGTGAGFPGIVLKIYMPELRLTLIESSKKKVSFLKYLVTELSRHHIVNRHQRVDVEILPNARKFVYNSRNISQHTIGFSPVMSRQFRIQRRTACLC